MIEEDSVRLAHSGPSQRFLRGLRPLVSVGPLPLPVSAGGHASSISTILLLFCSICMNRAFAEPVAAKLLIYSLLARLRCDFLEAAEKGGQIITL